ncbi:MAG TPA: response regulator, partial [Terriglobia bacterium]|nr:response regulator [Terriglobia bacterium]
MTCERHPVLIVEDEEFIRENFQIFLELEGFQVLTAGNGREALEQLQGRERPCLILLDLLMPVMDGGEFLERKASETSLASIP